MDGYYNSLLTFIDKAVEEGFINPSARRIIVLAPTAQELMDKLEVRDDRRQQILFIELMHCILHANVISAIVSCRSTCLITTGWRPRSTGRWAT